MGPKDSRRFSQLSTHLTAVVVTSVTVHRREGVRVPSAKLSQKSTCSFGEITGEVSKLSRLDELTLTVAAVAATQESRSSYTRR